MFSIFKRKTDIQSIAHEVPSRLLSLFGDKNTYAPKEVDIALQQLGYDKQRDIDHHHYAYGMFVNESSYQQLGLTDELGTYNHFQREVGKMLLNTPERIDMHIYFAISQQYQKNGNNTLH
ncbi:hypothetical protein [Vibrio sp. YIC-376]|uniref:hypothetical protein n=1 Tax=Vibrio sp. YIC-376 TaxID=3136162 RepID=UPI00402AC1BC